MARGRFGLIFIGSLACVLLRAPMVKAQSPAEGRRIVSGRVLVKFRPSVSASQANSMLASVRAQSIQQIPGIGVHIVALPAGASESAHARAFQARPEVEFAEVDSILPPAEVIPNDPLYPGEWHLTRISAPSAWGTTAGSTAITIAILDTGVNGSHEDLTSRMVPGWNIYDNNSNTSDVHGHGTTVAGTSAAAGNNSLGVASVAWNCYFMPIRVSDTTGSATYSAIANGLIWAADHGARVANVSYMVTDSSTVTSAAQYLQSRGGVVAVSAGNYSTFNSAADNPYILTVGATDANDVLYSWSNTGNNIDLVAPGCVVTTAKGGGYASGCGTSYSSPVVAGVAALILSVRPGLTPSQVTSILQQSADDLGAPGWDSTFGWGRVNAARAVNLAGGAPAPDTQAPTVSFQSPASGATVSGSITMQASASDNVGVVSVSYSVDGAPVGASTAAPYSYLLNTTTLTNGTHLLTATARDAAGNSAASTISVTVSNVRDQQAPAISIISPAAGSTVSGNVSVLVAASDNAGVVKVEVYVDGVLRATSTAAPFTTKVQFQRLARGSHTLIAKAFDAAGNVGISAPVAVNK